SPRTGKDEGVATKGGSSGQLSLRDEVAAFRYLRGDGRSRLTVSTTYAPAKSISASVVNRPIPKRRLALERASEIPMARRTWLGSGSADVQAEPELTAISVRLVIRASPSTPSKLTFRFPGSRSAGCPLTVTPSSCRVRKFASRS